MSVTSAMSEDDYSSDDQGHLTLMKKGPDTSQDSFLDITADIQDEIEELLSDIPEIDDHFTVKNKIGSGTFSSVFVAQLKKHSDIEEMFAIKHILPTSHPSRIEHELRCLHEIGGTDNVMAVNAFFRHRDHVVIIMPYFPHDKFSDLIRVVSLKEIQHYMRNLLVALRRVHHVGIIHRDIKPSNFLVNRKMKRYALVDFGLAQKAPETKPANKSSIKGDSGQYNLIPVSVRLENIDNLTESNSSKKNSTMNKRKHFSGDTENKVCPPAKRRVFSGDVTKQRKFSEFNVNRAHEVKMSQEPKKSMVMPLSCRQASQQGSSRDASIPSGNNAYKSEKMLSPSLEKNDLTLKKGFRNNSPRRALLTHRMRMPKKHDYQAQQQVTMVVESGGRSVITQASNRDCQCFGVPSVCSICLSRSHQVASRSGTPGFRSPEVLMKCPLQTTAVDVWSAGVIFLSLLTGRYPFFKAGDDMTALGQIIRVFGSKETSKAAKEFGKDLIVEPECEPINMRELCEKLRGVNKTTRGRHNSEWSNIPESAFDLISCLLDLNPNSRISASDALNHAFFSEEIS